MAVREFDGVDDLIVCSPGAVGALANGSHTLVSIAKKTTVSGPDGILSAQATTNVNLASLVDTGGGNLAYYNANDGTGVYEDLQATTWYIMAVTKPTGTVVPRVHLKVLGSGTWAHDDCPIALANIVTTCDRIEHGAFSTFGFENYADVRIAASAIYNTALSDANIESIQTTPSTQKLLDLGAVALWDFNQASTGTAVADLTPGGSNQTSIVGTTVVTGDDPPGWTFGVASATNSLIVPRRSGRGLIMSHNR